jgi:hypothetical protein
MLAATDKKLYARQVLLTEIGEAGQARLLQAGVGLPAGADARAAAVAADYLQRAGMQVDPEGAPIALLGSDALGALAGRGELDEAAAALCGAFAAVEAIKHVLDLGQRATLPATLALTPGEELRT